MKNKHADNPFLKYKNPDPRCTYPFDAEMCEACTFFVFKIDVAPIKNITEEECPKCKYWKKSKGGGDATI